MSNHLYILIGVFFMTRIISSVHIIGTLPKDYTGNDAQNWKMFKETFHQKYASTREEDTGKKVFLKKLKEAKTHNQMYRQGKVSYPVHITQYDDIEFEGLRRKWRNLHRPKTPSKNSKKGVHRNLAVSFGDTTPTAPASKDWRKEGKVTPVQNQGICGACWAFGAVAALEAAILIKRLKILGLSEQELIECVPDDEIDGCSGGYEDWAFEYIVENGILLRSVYPYVGMDRRQCKRYPRDHATKMKGYNFLPSGDEIALKNVIAFDGPVTIIMCTTDTFTSFGGDVFDNTDCFHYYDRENCTGIWHTMVVVGYGTTEEKKDYWLLKNSWGVEWGDYGYVKVARGKNLCDIASEPIALLI